MKHISEFVEAAARLTGQQTVDAINSDFRQAGNPWRWDGKNLFLPHPGDPEGAQGELYWIDRPRLETATEVCDWLAQLLEKTWVDDSVLAGLVRAIDRVRGLRPSCFK